MGSREKRDLGWDRGCGRFGVYGTVAAAVSVALLMAASPVAGAAKPHVIAPPYKGTSAVIYRSVSSYGSCKSSVALTGLHWIPKMGNVTGFVFATSKGCTTPPVGNGYAGASTDAQFEIGIPVKVFTNTGHNISVATSYAYTILASMVGAVTCPAAKNVAGTYTYSDCSLEVQGYASISTELYDQTNNSALYGENDYVDLPQNYTDIYNDSYCTGTGSCYSYNYTYSCHNSTYSVCAPSGTAVAGTNTTWVNSGNNCEYGYAGHCYYWHNWTLNSSHRYWVIEYVDINAYSYISGYAAGHSVVASVNGATLGNTGWRISSVTIA